MTKRITSFALLLVLSAAMLGLGFTSTSVNPTLQYQPDWLASGEWWRLLSAHIAHLNLTHAALNTAALWLLMAWLGEQYRTWEWLLVGTATGLGISLALWAFSPQISYYVGLSGVLHGLWLYGAAPLCRKGSMLGWLAAVGLIGKLTWEQLYPASSQGTESLINGKVITVAHLYGAIGGVVLFGMRELIGASAKRCAR